METVCETHPSTPHDSATSRITFSSKNSKQSLLCRTLSSSHIFVEKFLPALLYILLQSLEVCEDLFIHRCFTVPDQHFNEAEDWL